MLESLSLLGTYQAVVGRSDANFSHHVPYAVDHLLEVVLTSLTSSIKNEAKFCGCKDKNTISTVNLLTSTVSARTSLCLYIACRSKDIVEQFLRQSQVDHLSTSDWPENTKEYNIITHITIKVILLLVQKHRSSETSSNKPEYTRIGEEWLSYHYTTHPSTSVATY